MTVTQHEHCSSSFQNETSATTRFASARSITADPLVIRAIARLTDAELKCMDEQDLIDVFRFAALSPATSKQLATISQLPLQQLRRLAQFVRWQCQVHAGELHPSSFGMQ